MPGNQTTTQSTSSQPWDAAQPYLKDVLGGAQAAYNSGSGFKNPDFSTVVPFSQQTLQAQQGITNTANQGNPLAGQSMGALSGILQGNDNPYWQSQVNKQAGLLGDDISRQWSAGGRYGSQSMANDLGQQIGDFREKALSDNWQNNITNQLNAVQAAPGAYAQQFLPYQQLASVGAQQEDLATRTMNDQISRFNNSQQEPWNRLSAYNALIGGAGQLGGTSTTTATQPGNGLMQGIGGITSLLGLLGI